VTGGAGFIGSHLVDRLVERGSSVTVVDSLASGKREYLNPAARLYQLDVRSADLKRVVAEARPALVFHLAAQMSVAVSARAPMLDADININGTLNLLEAVRTLPDTTRPRVVFASSGGAVYGEPQSLPVSEQHVSRPASPYGASKCAGEVYLGTYRAVYGLEYSIMRLANVYGPRQDPHGEAGVVAIFGKAMIAGEPIRIFGDGTDERDYVYVSDVVDAFLAAGERGGPTAYNIGSGKGTSTGDMARLLARLTGYRKDPTMAPARAGDIRKIRLDVSKAGRELGWSPKVGLEEGLARTVKYLRASQTSGGTFRPA